MWVNRDSRKEGKILNSFYSSAFGQYWNIYFLYFFLILIGCGTWHFSSYVSLCNLLLNGQFGTTEIIGNLFIFWNNFKCSHHYNSWKAYFMQMSLIFTFSQIRRSLIISCISQVLSHQLSICLKTAFLVTVFILLACFSEGLLVEILSFLYEISTKSFYCVWKSGWQFLLF